MNPKRGYFRRILRKYANIPHLGDCAAMRKPGLPRSLRSLAMTAFKGFSVIAGSASDKAISSLPVMTQSLDAGMKRHYNAFLPFAIKCPAPWGAVILLVLSLWAGTFAVARTALAYFAPAGFGVRPAGMGEAFVSVADDANTMLFNPAGCAQISQLELTGMYSDLYAHLTARLYDGTLDRTGYNFMSLAAPVSALQGSCGVSWLQFQSAWYQENTFTAAYARQLLAMPVGDFTASLAVGAACKALQWRVAENEFTSDPVYYPYAERQKWGFTGDLGILLTLQKGLTFGFSAENLVPANMGLTMTEIIPVVWRAGASYLWRLENRYLDSLQAALELTARNDLSNSIYNPKAGVESWFLHHLLALRAGVNLNQATAGMSFGYPGPIKHFGMQLDYAFSYPLQVQDTWGSHRVGMTIRWDFQEYFRHEALARQTAREAQEKSALQAIAAAEAFKAAQVADSAKSVETAAAAAQNASKSAEYAKEIVRKAKQISKESLARASPEAGEASLKAIAQAEEYVNLAVESAVQADRQYHIALQAGEDMKAGNNRDAMQAQALAAKSAANQAVFLSEKSSQAVFQVIAAAEKTEYSRYFLPEKPSNRIVVGLDQQIVDEFGDKNEIRRMRVLLEKYLKTSVGIPVEIREYRLTDLEFAFTSGEIDVVVSDSEFFLPYYQHGMIKPMLTVKTYGRDSQRCLLLVRADSGLDRPELLKHKKVSYTRREVLPKIKQYFFENTKDYLDPGGYFGSLDIRKNALDSLLALQLKSADAIIEFEYVLNIYAKMKNDMPEVKIIAQSPLIPNAPAFQKVSKNHEKNQRLHKLWEAVLNFPEQPSAVEVFDFFNIDGFARYKENWHKRNLPSQ